MNRVIHDWPALIVGLTVLAYWYRVVRMARRMRRKTGRAANFIPREKTGRLLRVVWQPVVFIWVVHPLLNAFCGRLPAALSPLHAPAILQWIAAGVVIVAYVLTRICWNLMGKSWRMGIDPGEQTTLVVTGPYAAIRHPIYALSSLMMLGTVVAVPSPLMIVTAVLHVVLLQWECRREEHHLSAVHGPIYDDYLNRTGRFLPRVRRANPAGSNQVAP